MTRDDQRVVESPGGIFQGGYHWWLPRPRGLRAEERTEAADEATRGSAGSLAQRGMWKMGYFNGIFNEILTLIYKFGGMDINNDNIYIYMICMYIYIYLSVGR